MDSYNGLIFLCNKCIVRNVILSCKIRSTLRQQIENLLVLCHLKTLRLYTGIFKFELDHYLTSVARVKLKLS